MRWSLSWGLAVILFLNLSHRDKRQSRCSMQRHENQSTYLNSRSDWRKIGKTTTKCTKFCNLCQRKVTFRSTLSDKATRSHGDRSWRLLRTWTQASSARLRRTIYSSSRCAIWEATISLKRWWILVTCLHQQAVSIGKAWRESRLWAVKAVQKLMM